MFVAPNSLRGRRNNGHRAKWVAALPHVKCDHDCQAGGHNGHTAHSCGANRVGALVTKTPSGSFEQIKESDPGRIHCDQRLPSEICGSFAQRSSHGSPRTTTPYAPDNLRCRREAGAGRYPGFAFLQLAKTPVLILHSCCRSSNVEFQLILSTEEAQTD